VIVLVIDALRADRLGCYGSDRGATPNLDRFAAEAVLFANAQAQAPLTNPAVASLFTGLWPQSHGVTDLRFKLPERAPTLAETLAAGGVATAAVVANGNVDAGRGLARGFEHFKYLRDVRPGEYHARASDINEAVLAWLDREQRRPFFLYVHTLGPHSPYQPQEPFRSRFAGGVVDPELGSNAWQRRLERGAATVTPKTIVDVAALYDAEVAENDAAFGGLVEELRRRGLFDESVIVVLADHGEELFDHGGFGHGRHLHAEVLDIPLLIRFPHGRDTRRVERVVEQVDLMPTVLELFGFAAPAPVEGRSLLSLCGPSEPEDWKNRAVSHLDREGRVGVSLLTPSWKLILETRDGQVVPALYDRRADRRERRDLAGERPEEVEALRSALQALLDGGPGGLERPEPAAPPDQETLERLRSLGYVW
jgi:arylsulfatase A-like enzyme